MKFIIAAHDEAIISTYKNYNPGGLSYVDMCMEYRKTVKELATKLKEGECIIVYIHAGFPQKKENFRIVTEGGREYREFISTDDWNKVMDYVDHINLTR